MAFGQANGYPATRSQMEQLEELILAAGHTDFRDARGPLGLTQRQAGGKFTRDEADEFIALLEAETAPEDGPPDAPSVPAPKHPVNRGRSPAATGLARIPTDKLAAELQRRGWVVMEP